MPIPHCNYFLEIYSVGTVIREIEEIEAEVEVVVAATAVGVQDVRSRSPQNPHTQHTWEIYLME